MHLYLLEPCFQRLFNKLYSFCFIIYNFTFGTLIKVKCCKSEGKEVSGGSSTEHPIPIKIGTVCAATSCQSPVYMQQENFLAAFNASTIKYQSSMKQKVASPEWELNICCYSNEEFGVFFNGVANGVFSVQCFALFKPSIACVSWWPRTIELNICCHSIENFGVLFQWGRKWCVQCFALFNPSIACVSWWPRTILACFTSLPMISFMELSRWCHPCSSWQCELVPPHSIYVSCFQKKVIPCLAGLTPNKTAQS